MPLATTHFVSNVWSYRVLAYVHEPHSFADTVDFESPCFLPACPVNPEYCSIDAYVDHDNLNRVLKLGGGPSRTAWNTRALSSTYSDCHVRSQEVVHGYD